MLGASALLGAEARADKTDDREAFDEAVDLIIIDDSYEGFNLTDDADYSLSENQGNLCITVILG